MQQHEEKAAPPSAPSVPKLSIPKAPRGIAPPPANEPPPRTQLVLSQEQNHALDVEAKMPVMQGQMLDEDRRLNPHRKTSVLSISCLSSTMSKSGGASERPKFSKPRRPQFGMPWRMSLRTSTREGRNLKAETTKTCGPATFQVSFMTETLHERDRHKRRVYSSPAFAPMRKTFLS